MENEVLEQPVPVSAAQDELTEDGYTVEVPNKRKDRLMVHYTCFHDRPEKHINWITRLVEDYDMVFNGVEANGSDSDTLFGTVFLEYQPE
jgi:hypothetical protein